MTKKEILKIIEMELFIINNNKIMKIPEPYDNSNIRIDESMWFPNIPELKSDFDILKKEIKKVIGIIDEYRLELNKIKREITCNHTIREFYNYGFCNTSKCIFCNKIINGDNVKNGNTIYNDINRNKNCVMIQMQDYDEDGHLINGYTIKQVYEIIKEILKDKQDDEGIDFIKEFKKLNLKYCEIDERPLEKEYYVLIIGGSNKHYINEKQYIISDKLLDSIEIAYYLCGIPKVNVELIENKEAYETQKFKKRFPYTNISNIKFENYSLVEELNKKIELEKNVPFDIIIDMSTLFEYKDEHIKPYNLNLKEVFPNSYNIKIEKHGLKTSQELLKILKDNLTIYDNAYLQSNNEYYYLNNENFEKTNLTQTCKNIKKLILKKE